MFQMPPTGLQPNHLRLSGGSPTKGALDDRGHADQAITSSNT